MITMPRVGIVPFQAPIPAPPRFGLLSAALLSEPASDRWLNGAWTGGNVPGPAFTHDPCSRGTERVKVEAGVIASQTTAAFNVYVTGECTAQSIGPDPAAFVERLRQVFAVYEQAAVERVMATGDGHTVLGPYLGDSSMQDLTGPVALDPIQAYGILEQAVAQHGGGMLHVSQRVFGAWRAFDLVGAEDGVIVTELGTPVAVGYGYANVTPDAGPPPTPTEQWAFASGLVEVIREPEIQTVPQEYSEAFLRSTNDVIYLAERAYLLNWLGRSDENDSDHTQAGVLVDVSKTGGGGGSGASYAIETPAGLVNGSNDTFTLSQTPSSPADLLLWKNGLLMHQGDDYTLAGTTIVFSADQIPPVGSIIVAAVPI